MYVAERLLYLNYTKLFSMIIRKIAAEDNIAIAAIVKQVMEKFKADPKTTVLGDPSLHTMYQNYQEPQSVYYVVEINGEITGGCGIRKLSGSDGNICELQRMFLLNESRRKGIGKKLLQLCLTEAKNFGYKQVYLESLKQMTEAIMLYESSGFKRLSKPLGETGHGGCDVNMILDL
jgi:putative acetyltransferase